MNKIGFVGMGSMGAPLAGRLLPGNQAQGSNRARPRSWGYGHRDIAGLFRVLAKTAGVPDLGTDSGTPATSIAAGPKAA